MSCGADTTANSLLTSLIAGKDFTLPNIDLSDGQFAIPDGTGSLYLPLVSLTNADLTTRIVGGTGTFDALMASVSAHLKVEFEQNRITGAEYTKAYVGIVGGALQTAASYLLGRDQAYWQSVLAQQQARAAEIQVIAARVGLETAKAQLAIAVFQAANAEADFGLTKMKIATEDQQYCLLLAQTTAANYQNTDILPIQKKLMSEQAEVQRAQTLDARSDGQMITGSVGKQKELYDQQITSYKRDAEVKMAKLFTDAWITQKTIDEGLLAPDGFTNASLDTILTHLKAKNDLD